MVRGSGWLKSSIEGERSNLTKLTRGIFVNIPSSSIQTSLECFALESAGATNDTVSWSVRYRVNAIDNAAKSLVDIDVPVPGDDLRHIVTPELLEDSPESRFQFPLAFGTDLQEIVVLHTVIRPRPALAAYSGETIRLLDSQTIDLAPKGISSLERPYQELKYPRWYRIWMSQTRRFLAVTKRRGKPDIVEHNPWGVWSLTIWEDISQADQGPSYQPLGEIYLNTTHLGKDGFLAFHPTLPLVVASGDVEAVCWTFKSKGKPSATLLKPWALTSFRASS